MLRSTLGTRDVELTYAAAAFAYKSLSVCLSVCLSLRPLRTGIQVQRCVVAIRVVCKGYSCPILTFYKICANSGHYNDRVSCKYHKIVLAIDAALSC